MTPSDDRVVGEPENVASEKAVDRNDAAPPGRWGQFREAFLRVAAFGRVELRGITPIPVKERTVERTINIFTLWWSMNTNILAWVNSVALRYGSCMSDL
jgi:hypothetical protein